MGFRGLTDIMLWLKTSLKRKKDNPGNKVEIPLTGCYVWDPNIVVKSGRNNFLWGSKVMPYFGGNAYNERRFEFNFCTLNSSPNLHTGYSLAVRITKPLIPGEFGSTT